MIHFMSFEIILFLFTFFQNDNNFVTASGPSALEEDEEWN